MGLRQVQMEPRACVKNGERTSVSHMLRSIADPFDALTPWCLSHLSSGR